MTRRRRRMHAPSFKAMVAVAAVRGEVTLVELAQQYDLHPNQVQEWKKRLIAGAEQLFLDGRLQSGESTEDKLQELHAKIGELTMERDLLSKALGRDK